jgi:alpha-glucuronidase
MKSGRTLWDELVAKYYQGAADAAGLQATWKSLAGRVDPQRHQEVADRLVIQVEHAAAWRDQILKYFQGFSGMPINPPAGLPGPSSSTGA